MHGLQTRLIIIECVFQWGRRVFADIDTQYPFVLTCLDSADHMVESFIVEAHPINDGLMFRQAE